MQECIHAGVIVKAKIFKSSAQRGSERKRYANHSALVKSSMEDAKAKAHDRKSPQKSALLAFFCDEQEATDLETAV